MKHAAAVLLTWFIASSANAQQVYRCGSIYTDSPCPQGTVLDAADPRSSAQRADAQRVAADEKRLGAQMEHDRLAELAALKPATTARAQVPRAAASASAPAHDHLPTRRHAAKRPATTDFTALDPSTVRHRTVKQ